MNKLKNLQRRTPVPPQYKTQRTHEVLPRAHSMPISRPAPNNWQPENENVGLLARLFGGGTAINVENVHVQVHNHYHTSYDNSRHHAMNVSGNTFDTRTMQTQSNYYTSPKGVGYYDDTATENAPTFFEKARSFIISLFIGAFVMLSVVLVFLLIFK